MYHFPKSSPCCSHGTKDTDELKLLFYALPTLRKELEIEQGKENRDQNKIFELEAAVQFTREHYDTVFTTLEEFPDNHIDFGTLWTRFPHHILVYSSDQLGQGRAYRVDYLDSDGKWVGYVESRTLANVPQFSGSKSIHDLPFCPLSLHRDQDGVQKQLIARGSKVLSLKGQHLQGYKGHALAEDKDKYGSVKLKKFNSHGRVMIDPVTFNEIVPNNSIVPQIPTPLIESKLSDDEKMLLNPLASFVGAFAISRLEPVTWNDAIIDSLVLYQERKDFIRDLVRHHAQRDNTSAFDDFVPPGVGKTLTAEVVAEIAHRPLYVISSGELGETSSSVQARLMRAMELAETWKAVVLLDEADVFLAERDDDSLSRNAITSIFLRHLEYYQGILLLTTNRLDSFDEAFQSRIHF
ncbi:P-loop containing nucleoside triphosphate hydrolase protein [Diplogelasinospora grovesii]|uniref:P-loop containing nucleoside triphosphate hydrolase protein n=1 Tax=Diplogelasinospora grovesii TaxID=303347 RepID=A0AAN6N9M8_9PEZI|nr:P-loop containing nucleoside triphosphate hydrolase protein [Diplogelasinospora grovesii]